MKSSSEHRQDFVDNMINGVVEKYKKVLEERQELMCQDYLFRGLSAPQAIEELHKNLEQMLLGRGLDIGRVMNSTSEATDPSIVLNLNQHRNQNHHQNQDQNIHRLWSSQKIIHDEILQNINTGGIKRFLITGPAKSGKSRLMAVLAENLKVQTIKTICTAYTAQLASQYHEGVNWQRLLKLNPSEYNVILIDHGNLIPEEKLKGLDEHLRASCSSQEPFAGKTVVIFADFKQFLPYTDDFKNKAEQSLMGKDIIGKFKKFSLGENLCEVAVRSFDKQCIVSTPEELILETYQDALSSGNSQLFEHRVILAPTNANVDMINKEVLNRFPGNPIVLSGWSQAKSTDGKRELKYKPYYTAEVRDIPDHTITVKPNCIISLLRTQDGLSKGTRLIFLSKTSSASLKCRLLSGPQKGQEVSVNSFQYEDEKATVSNSTGKSSDFLLARKQFPISLGFAMTIHRAQGQFFQRLGLYNMDEAFDKEAKYTAMTRCHQTSGVRVCGPNSMLALGML